MGLNESKGNMYPFVTHTWNTIKGKCPHDCAYCYMKRFGKQPELHFDEKELKTDLGEGNFIFVGSSCDMWERSIPKQWISETINHCIDYDHHNNAFLFQTKNPHQMIGWAMPNSSILGTTIETNRVYPQMGNTPSPKVRAISMMNLAKYNRTMLTIEPIFDFDLNILIGLIKICNPQWVNIGADSQGHNLPEPKPEKVDALIKELKKFTEVKVKKNLKRLYNPRGNGKSLSNTRTDKIQ